MIDLIRKYVLKQYFLVFALAISMLGCLSTKPVNIESAEKEMVTGYINFPKNESDIENNRKVEKKFINLAPMYGYAKKNLEYQAYDRQFLTDALTACKCTRAEASIISCDKGWDYFFKGNAELASKRFNQAYLLDSTNYIIYWGFGVIMGRQRRYEESFALFEKADSACTRKNDTVYAFFCLDYSQSLFGKYAKCKQKKYADKAFALVDEANSLRPEYAKTYFNYSHMYFETAQYPKALESYNKSVALYPRYADSTFRKAILDSLKQ